LTRKIVITGPESTGKSQLASGLAAHFNTVVVPEFARTYIDGLNRPYDESDLFDIARGQLALENDGLSRAEKMLFCDTGFLVLKIWSMHRYNRCHPFILEQLKRNPGDLYLLCNIDLPWEFDPQREHPHLRQFFFDWYQRELKQYGFPHLVISGQGEQRLQHAIEGVTRFYNKAQ
jgi:NadR type nicotinamide-nucleotide adenylyltransferase